MGCGGKVDVEGLKGGGRGVVRNRESGGVEGRRAPRRHCDQYRIFLYDVSE